jgi:hypothetical protein
MYRIEINLNMNTSTPTLGLEYPTKFRMDFIITITPVKHHKMPWINYAYSNSSPSALDFCMQDFIYYNEFIFIIKVIFGSDFKWA